MGGFPGHGQASPAAGFWETHINPEGIPYYFNPVTMVSTWEPPPELFAPPKPGGFGGHGRGFPGGGMDPSFLARSLAPAFGAPGPDLPQRPGETECAHFLKTGQCRYGATCKFHHPLSGSGMQMQTHYPVRPGEPDCSFYIKTGSCKYGAQCKFNHPPSDPSRGPASRAPLTTMPGAPPERPGEPECAFYMKTGQCKYGAQCKFHHPPSAAAGQAGSQHGV